MSPGVRLRAKELRDAFEREAAARAGGVGNAATPEDEILRALLAGDEAQLTRARRLRAGAALIDHDYLAYWVDELGLQRLWREIEGPSE